MTDLHGGRITVVDPVPGETGARFRVELPTTAIREEPDHGRTCHTHAATRRRHRRPSPTARTAGSGSLVDDTFGSLWADRGVPPLRWVLLACLGIGLFAALTLPDANLGLAATLVLVASGVLVLVLTRHRRSPFTWACAVLAFGFALVLVAARRRVDRGARRAGRRPPHHGGADRRRAPSSGWSLGALAWPFSGLRGLPWLGRTLRAFGGGANAAAVTRTVLLSLLGVLVFGLLFASGDAIFGHWVGAVLPDVEDTSCCGCS